MEADVGRDKCFFSVMGGTSHKKKSDKKSRSDYTQGEAKPEIIPAGSLPGQGAALYSVNDI